MENKKFPYKTMAIVIIVTSIVCIYLTYPLFIDKIGAYYEIRQNKLESKIKGLESKQKRLSKQLDLLISKMAKKLPSRVEIKTASSTERDKVTEYQFSVIEKLSDDEPNKRIFGIRCDSCDEIFRISDLLSSGNFSHHNKCQNILQLKKNILIKLKSKIERLTSVSQEISRLKHYKSSAEDIENFIIELHDYWHPIHEWYEFKIWICFKML